MLLEALIADFLGFTEDEVRLLARDAPSTYRSYRVPKKLGGHRTIFHPSKETKALQYALMGLFLEDLPIHDAAMAYRRGVRSPLRKMASVHSGFKFSVRLDAADFFPSITPALLFAQLDKLNDEALARPEASNRSLLRNALFVNVGKRGLGLAIGAPSSPMVSNFIMHRADASLTDRAHSLRGSYSRYADDMYFSTDVPGSCRKFAHGAEAILSDEFSSDLSLNPGKTLYMSRGTRRVIAGIFITPDGSISIGRNKKRYIKKLVHEFRVGKLEQADQVRLRGFLSYVLDVEPAFFNRLAMKYGAEILSRALSV